MDLTYALRSLRRKPGFTLLVASVLAVGIGAATAIATVYGTVLLRPLAVRDQDRVVIMHGEHLRRGFPHVPLDLDQFRELERRTRTLSQTSAVLYNGAVPHLFRDRGNPLRISGLWVSGRFFEALGARALLGRTLRPEDDVSSAPAAIVISHAAWRHRFGGDPVRSPSSVPAR